MKQDVKCRRCGHIVFAGNLQDKQMKRHVEGRHTKHKTVSERDGMEIKGFTNLDIGKVVWDTIW